MGQPVSQEEQAAALAALQGLQPAGSFPTASASGQTARLHGRYATLQLSTQAPQTVPGGVSPFHIATGPQMLVFHWELEVMQEFADVTAHGDFWRVRIPLTQDWTARVQGYMTRAAVQTYLSTMADNYSNTGLGADPLPMTLQLYNDAGTNLMFQGTCYGQRGRVIKPMAMVTQELELVSAQVPATVSH